MQFSLPVILVSLLTFVSSTPIATPIERCTAADAGKSCKAGEINGFYVTGFCTKLPIRPDQSQFACLPGNTLLNPEGVNS